MHSDYVVKGRVIDSKTGTIKQLGADDVKKLKKYVVVAKCGHCGNGYYLPVAFSVFAKDKESAIMIARNIPRVKRDNKYYILGIKEISNPEITLVNLINDNDRFLVNDLLDEDNEEVQARRVIEDNMLDLVNEKSYVKIDKYKKRDRDITYFSTKTAEDYDESMVLQRAFAPIKNGDKYVCKRTVNMDEILRRYYAYAAHDLGVNKKCVVALLYYYEIMGENNDLGVTFDGKSIRYKYCGSEIEFDVTPAQAEHIKSSLESGSKYKPKETITEDVYQTADKYETAVDKFYKRYPGLAPKPKSKTATDKFYERYPQLRPEKDSIAESQPGVE